MMEHLAAWLASQPGRFAGTPAFAHAVLLLAEAARTMGHIRDHVQVRWYPPGSYVVEQGEAAAELFLILSGEAETWRQGSGGRRERLGRLGAGEFFGELGIAGAGPAAATWSRRQPHLPGPVPGTAGHVRGRGPEPGWPVHRPARGRTRPRRPGTRAQAQGVVCCDVSGQVMRKVGALSAYRSQFPLEPGMFPEFLLREMFGCEYFVAGPARPADPDEMPPGLVREPALSAPLPAR